MVEDRSRISNMAQTADARTFSLNFQVEVPQNNLVVYVEPRADFPFEIVAIRALCTVGFVSITPKVDAQIVNTDLGDGAGKIVVNQPSLITAIPDGTITSVGQNQAFTFTLTDLSTLPTGLVVKVTCRRTDVNVAV